jgi:hypothetical protein
MVPPPPPPPANVLTNPTLNQDNDNIREKGNEYINKFLKMNEIYYVLKS